MRWYTDVGVSYISPFSPCCGKLYSQEAQDIRKPNASSKHKLSFIIHTHSICDFFCNALTIIMALRVLFLTKTHGFLNGMRGDS